MKHRIQMPDAGARHDRQTCSLACLALLSLLSGCLEMPSIVYSCGDGRCPEGFVCNPEQRCVRPTEEVMLPGSEQPGDAGLDGSRGDQPDHEAAVAAEAVADTGPDGAGDVAAQSASGSDPCAVGFRQCEPGTMQTKSEACQGSVPGLQMRVQTCRQEDCRFGDLVAIGACVPSSVCTPNASESLGTMACGNCGQLSITRTCDAAGNWQAPVTGPCESQGECTPSAEMAVATAACGRCGTQTSVKRCTSSCMWSEPVAGACSGERECTPGTTMSAGTETCGRCGTRALSRTCSDSCSWGDPVAAACSMEGECVPNTTSSVVQSCGRCGKLTVSRLCNASCGWQTTSTSPCINSGSCVPPPDMDPDILAKPHDGPSYVQDCGPNICRTYPEATINASTLAECRRESEMICGGAPYWLCNRASTDCRDL